MLSLKKLLRWINRRLSYLPSKISIFLIRIIFIPLSYVLWVLEPFVKVRFHRGQTDRLGHLALYFETLVRSKEIFLDQSVVRDIFIVKKIPANEFLYGMWKKHFIFVESDFLDFVYHSCSRSFDSHRKHFGPLRVPHSGLLDVRPTLRFSIDEKRRGRRLLNSLGIHDTDWFVCLHNRDSVYLSKTMPGRDFTKHNLRNCKFENLIPAAKLIESKGGKAVKMSSGDGSLLDPKNNSMIIDYSGLGQTPFMDIYLPAHCKFFIGPTSGIAAVSMMFNVPIGQTNCFPVASAVIPKRGLFIPKLIWSKEKDRVLSYREISDLQIGNQIHAAAFEALGLEVLENSADDISLLLEDMLDFTSDFTIASKHEILREKFLNKYFSVTCFTNKHVKPSGLEKSGKISWRFLEKHSYLMD